MFYFVEILYILSAVYSVNLESRQRKPKNSFLFRNQKSIYIHPNSKSEDEPNLSEPLQKYGSSLVRNDFKYSRSQTNREDTSNWSPIQSYGHQYAIYEAKDSVRQREIVLERDSMISKSKRVSRTTQRKHAVYKSTRLIYKVNTIRIQQKDQNVNQILSSNGATSSSIQNPDPEPDSGLRLWILKVMKYMGFKDDADNQSNNKNNDKKPGINSFLRFRIPWLEEFTNHTKWKIRNAVNDGIVKNIKVTTHNVSDKILDVLNNTQYSIRNVVEQYILKKKEPYVKDDDTDVENGSEKTTTKKPCYAPLKKRPLLHRVQDDLKVNTFIKKILNHNLRLFRTVGSKTSNNILKKKVNFLAEAYKDKFSEFINETRTHMIKSGNGIERVVLNSVDVSNSILKKLINFFSDENDEGYTDTLSIIDKELKEETKSELERACLKLDVCRTSKGMSTFLADIATKIMSLDNKDFEVTFNNLVKAIKHKDFSTVLDSRTDRGIRETMERFRSLDQNFQRAAVTTVRNILKNLNKPFEIYDDSNVSQLNKTLAFLEIVKILDENVPDSEENKNNWANIINQDITLPSTTRAIVNDVIRVLRELDNNTVADILVQSKIIYK